MTVIFVGAGPGDPDLLTVKAQRLLRECRVCVYAGSLVSPEVVSLLPADAERYDSASMHLEEIVAVFRRAHENGLNVVRLHTGDPSIYGAINEQMRELEKIAIPYEVVPGVSAFQAAAASWKTELTEQVGRRRSLSAGWRGVRRFRRLRASKPWREPARRCVSTSLFTRSGRSRIPCPHIMGRTVRWWWCSMPPGRMNEPFQGRLRILPVEWRARRTRVRPW
jgi:hypothetical protein